MDTGGGCDDGQGLRSCRLRAPRPLICLRPVASTDDAQSGAWSWNVTPNRRTGRDRTRRRRTEAVWGSRRTALCRSGGSLGYADEKVGTPRI